jgi:chromatin segregation and condensation protein Rec8/ScpA/Scc1 (kleisin family)
LIASNSNHLSSSSAIGAVLDELDDLADRGRAENVARIRQQDAARAAAVAGAEQEAQREAATVKAHVETSEERAHAKELAEELRAAVEHRNALIRESRDYAHHDIHRGMEIVGQLEVIEAYISCLQYEAPVGQPGRTCYRPSSLTVIKW